MFPSDLTTAQYKQLERYLPIVKKTRPKKYSIHYLLNGILYILKTGSPWRNLPESYPPWKSCHKFLTYLSRENIFSHILFELNKKERKEKGRSPTPSILVMYSCSKHSCEYLSLSKKGYDGFKKNHGIKLFTLVDTQGRLWRSLITTANTQDKVGAEMIISQNFESRKTTSNCFMVLGDMGFESKRLTNELYRKYKVVLLTKRLKRKYKVKDNDQNRYNRMINNTRKRIIDTRRWVVERTYAHQNKFRRLITVFERTTKIYDSFVKLASITLLLKRMG